MNNWPHQHPAPTVLSADGTYGLMSSEEMEEELTFRSEEEWSKLGNVDQLFDLVKSRIAKHAKETLNKDFHTLKDQLVMKGEKLKTREQRVQFKEFKLKQRETDLKLLEAKVKESLEQDRDVPDEKFIAQGCTIAIYEALIDQIGYWHSNGEYHEEFVDLSRRFLYPLVYEKVADGYEGYYVTHLDKTIADDITFLGRNLCKALKSRCVGDAPTNFHLIKEWWTEIAMPCLYDGAADPTWLEQESWSKEKYEMFSHYRREENRLDPVFLNINKALNLLDSQRPFIRMFAGTKEFTIRSMTTRLND